LKDYFPFGILDEVDSGALWRLRISGSVFIGR
jgi:hypothetical protein